MQLNGMIKSEKKNLSVSIYLIYYQRQRVEAVKDPHLPVLRKRTGVSRRKQI